MSTKPLTEAQLQEALDTFELHGRNETRAAIALNLKRPAFQHRIREARMRGLASTVEQTQTLHGYNPDHDLTHPVPAPFVLRGVSTLYNKGGERQLQWVKTKLDDQKVEALFRESMKVLSREVAGLSPITPVPGHCDEDLLAVYPLGDPHIGMYSWAKETGEAFDLEIAREVTLGAVDRLVGSAPPAGTAIVLPLGDVFHVDDQTNATPGNGHQLDADSRYVKMLGIGVEIFRHIVLRALEKHQKVIVRFVRGNHDPHSVWALAFTISAFFESEPRVEVDLSPSWFWYHKFGKVLIGSTHGDVTKTERLPGIMACDKHEDWGKTSYRYWYTGHVHHSTVKEYPGVVCESFRTLAAKDGYAAGHGYRAGRDMVCIVHHKDYGEVERHRCDIGMIRHEAGA